MGLFDKKYCDICGDKIGLLGNRKLEDGNLCKKCAAKLSPWFSERRQSTLAEIKAQLAYREENREAVKAFHTTRTLGRNVKVLLDEDARKFMVTSARDLEEANPDVLDFAQVTGCDLDVDKSRSEIYRKDKDGKNISYNPKKYEYSYNFYVIIHVNHPYFDEMRFRLNSSSVEVGEHRIGEAVSVAKPSGKGMAQTVIRNAEYTEFQNMGMEIREALTQVRESVREEAAPKKAVLCPHCGATTMPDANGCCEYCGGALNG